MFRLLEQSQLGSYDSILLGTLCNIDAVTLHPDYQRFVALGMSAFVAPPDNEHKRFVDSQESTEDKVLALSLFTLFAHENRHFWDIITTCSGLRHVLAALEVQYEYLTCHTQLWSREAVYLPFSEWVRDHKKLERISSSLATPPPEAEAFATTTERFLKDLGEWDLGGRDPRGSPTSTQIMEGLAVLAQGEAVHRYFGEDARTLFFDTLRAGETGRWYLGAVDHVRSRLPELDLDGQGLLLEMALYGSVELPAREGSPAAVLPYLIERFETTRPRFPTSFAELYALCDGYLSLLQGFGPMQSYGNAGKALFARLNELGTKVLLPNESGPVADKTRSVGRDLVDYVARTVNRGARLVQKVLFAGHVGNLRLTQQCSGLYEAPRATPYFESSHGLLMGSHFDSVMQSLIGTTVAPGRKSALEGKPDNSFFELLGQFPDDDAVNLLYMFAPKEDGAPDYVKLSWKLFPHMFLCRMAIVGPSETDSLASVLLSNFLSGAGKPIYARGRRIAPFDE